MGIDGLSFFGKDYAAEFKEKWGSQIEADKQKLSSAGITVPIGQPQENKKNDNKGLEVEKEQTQKENFKRQFTSNDDIKKAEEAAEKEFLKNGVSKGDNTETVKEGKQAEKLAKNYVENEYNKEQVAGTQVFMDKKAYKEAEKARKEQRKNLIDEYREQGMSRKDAKRAAESQLVENEYVYKKIKKHHNDLSLIVILDSSMHNPDKNVFAFDKLLELGEKELNNDTNNKSEKKKESLLKKILKMKKVLFIFVKNSTILLSLEVFSVLIIMSLYSE